jgi:cytochrome c oxidase assembly factor CtaG
LAARPVRAETRALSRPAVAAAIFAVAFWAWHVPALYDRALASELWHGVEHASFLAAALCFWRLVVAPRSAAARWAMVPYLLLAEFQNTVLAAILTFSDRVIYRAYAAEPRPWGASPLEDQALAGVIMWVPGSLAFVLPILWLVAAGLGPPRATSVTAPGSAASSPRPRRPWLP